MQYEPIPAEREGAIDGAVVASMTVACQRPSSTDQCEREVGGNVAASLDRLLISAYGRTSTAVAERAVLSQLPCDEHEERWELGELEAVLSDLPGCAVVVAIERLARHGAIVRAENRIAAASCPRHLDSLGMVAI
jgi:hypothetical protein